MQASGAAALVAAAAMEVPGGRSDAGLQPAGPLSGGLLMVAAHLFFVSSDGSSTPVSLVYQSILLCYTGSKNNAAILMISATCAVSSFHRYCHLAFSPSTPCTANSPAIHLKLCLFANLPKLK